MAEMNQTSSFVGGAGFAPFVSLHFQKRPTKMLPCYYFSLIVPPSLIDP